MAGEQFLQLVAVGACGGRPVANMFWYVNEDIGSGLPYALAEELAVEFTDTVWGPLGGLLPQIYIKERAVVTVYDDQWNVQTTPAFEYPVVGTGSINVALPGRRLAALFKAQLIQPAFYPRADGHLVTVGRLMVGPLFDGLVDNTDLMVPSAWPGGAQAAFMTAAAAELGGAQGHTFTPIRVSDVQRDVSGGALGKSRSAAKISGWVLRAKSTTQNQRAG